MKQSIAVQDLFLEVTRRCNMTCEHCLRGQAQNVDMTTDMVDKIIDMCDSISHITFTGGEPTLNLAVIAYTFDKCMEKWGYVPPFFIATNGKEHQLELIPVLAKAYANCDESEREYCAVSLSVDIFHDTVDMNYLKALSFYSSSKEHNPSDSTESWLINMGRAEEYGLAERDPVSSLDTSFYTERYNDTISIESLGVTALGEIVTACDYSYDMAKENHVCMLNELKEVVLAEE